MRSPKPAAPSTPPPNPPKPTASPSLPPEVLHTLTNTFGHESLRPGQHGVIAAVLRRESAVAVFPTGRGKSLCYQLPALHLDGITLVVSPLLALMKDQVDALVSKGVKAATLDSMQTQDDARAVKARVKKGDIALLFVSPERFNNEAFIELIKTANVALFVVDEAHCISQWGHAFRPDYLKLANFAKEINAKSVLALTATATPAVQADILESFNVSRENLFTASAYRPNLTLRVSPTATKTRDADLLAALQAAPAGPAIVYVTQQKTATTVAAFLKAAGVAARGYHAGMKPEERLEIQEWFMESKDGVVVATIAFGMGVDKADIRYVYHYNLPKSIENYSQEIGRAGRDGLDSICHTFACADDIDQIESMIYCNTPTQKSVRRLVGRLFGPQQPGLAVGQVLGLSLYDLGDELDTAPNALKLLLAFLNIYGGYVRETTPHYNNYDICETNPSESIFKSPHPAAAILVEHANPQKKRKYTQIDFSAVATESDPHFARARIIKAINDLERDKVVTVKVSQVRNRFIITAIPKDLDALAAKLYRLMLDQENLEVQRFREVRDVLTSKDCQVARFISYFGDANPEGWACGHCQACTEPRELRLEKVGGAEPVAEDPAWEKVLKAKDVPKDDARLLARFASGMSSPRIRTEKLNKHALHGSLVHQPFIDIYNEAMKVCRDD